MSENNQVIFLLGAGAAVDAGLPTSYKLTELVQEDIARKHSELLPLLRFIGGAIQFGRACRNESPRDGLNIEELLTACTFLSSRNSSSVYPFVGAWHERIRDLEKLPPGIPDDVSGNSFQFLASFCKDGLREWLAIKDYNQLEYLTGLGKFIAAKFKLRIFSLNYDLSLEYALSRMVGEINGQWTNGFNEQGWDPSLFAREFNAYLYKLHGSLDWVNDSKLGICSIAWPAAQQSEELPSEVDPLLVFGINNKLQAIDPFLTLLFYFQQCLRNCKILVVIGYRFGDDHINAMILEALQRDPQMRCVIVNRNPLDTILPKDSDFQRLVNVEQRFVSITRTAKEAIGSDMLINKVLDIAKMNKEEIPF